MSTILWCVSWASVEITVTFSLVSYSFSLTVKVNPVVNVDRWHSTIVVSVRGRWFRLHRIHCWSPEGREYFKVALEQQKQKDARPVSIIQRQFNRNSRWRRGTLVADGECCHKKEEIKVIMMNLRKMNQSIVARDTAVRSWGWDTHMVRDTEEVWVDVSLMSWRRETS